MRAETLKMGTLGNGGLSGKNAESMSVWVWVWVCECVVCYTYWQETYWSTPFMFKNIHMCVRVVYRRCFIGMSNTPQYNLYPSISTVVPLNLYPSISTSYSTGPSSSDHSADAPMRRNAPNKIGAMPKPHMPP